MWIVVFFEVFFFAELFGEFAPDTEACICLTAGKADNSYVAFKRVVAEESLAVFGVFCKQAQGNHAVGFTTTHVLGELYNTVVVLTGKAGKGGFEQDIDAFGKITFAKKPLGVDAISEQMADF